MRLLPMWAALVVASHAHALPVLRPILPDTPAYQSSTLGPNVLALAGLEAPKSVAVLTDSPGRTAALERYAAAVADPLSPDFHRYLTPSQLMARFGPTAPERSAVRQALRTAGWTVTGQSGFLTTAVAHPGDALPVSAGIAAIGGLTGGTVRPAVSLPTAPTFTVGTQQSPYTFSVESWQPDWSAGLLNGLPVDLLITAQENGAPIGITQVTSFDGSLDAETSGFPAGGTAWVVQMLPLSDAPASTLSLTVTLADGSVHAVSVTLPQVSGAQAQMSEMMGSQLDALSGFGSVPANLPPVGIFSLGPGPIASDVSLTMAYQGLPDPNLEVVYNDGQEPLADASPGFILEDDLDVELLGSMLPGDTILDEVYPESDPLALFNALNAITQQSAVHIWSFSYAMLGQNLPAITFLSDAASVEGDTLVAASGDTGAWNGYGTPGVYDLDQVPSILSVGGVEVSGSLSDPELAAWGGSYLQELADPEDAAMHAATGGYGTTAAPAWQVPLLPAGAPGIGTPDVASLADWPYVRMFVEGQNMYAWGTSVAAQVTAGGVALAEGASQTGPLGNVAGILFRLAPGDPGLFDQALWGSNGLYTVTSSQPGTWNPVTGLGLVNWAKFGQTVAPLLAAVPAAPSAGAAAAKAPTDPMGAR